MSRSRMWPTSRDVSELAARVADLSAAYNDPRHARASARDAGAARLGFSFVRDVPKGAAAVRELVALGALPRGGSLRVLDLGAGMGAMTWGLALAREAAGGEGAVDATWVDGDAEALDVGMELLRARSRSGPGADRVSVRVVRASLDASAEKIGQALAAAGAFGVVLVGQVLSELDVGADPVERASKHARWLRRLLDEHVSPEGSLVVVEPALRDRTRHLHRVRDSLLARGDVTVFAPCTHASGCPALAVDGDWCHEDLPVDLPPWLVPVARAAGLRFEGLTFSYLVLRRDGLTLRRALSTSAGSALLRAVSGPIKTKGKLEAFLCGEFLADGGGRATGSARTTRLDRDASAANGAWDRVVRGDLVQLAAPLPLGRARIAAGSAVVAAVGRDARGGQG